jgi:hypothetical protein
VTTKIKDVTSINKMGRYRAKTPKTQRSCKMASITNSLVSSGSYIAPLVASAPAQSSLTWKIISAVWNIFKKLGSLLLSHYVNIPLLLAGGTAIAHHQYNVLDPVLNLFRNRSSTPAANSQPSTTPQNSPIRSSSPVYDPSSSPTLTPTSSTPSSPPRTSDADKGSHGDSSKPAADPAAKPHHSTKKTHQKKPELNEDGTPKKLSKKPKHRTHKSLENPKKTSTDKPHVPATEASSHHPAPAAPDTSHAASVDKTKNVKVTKGQKSKSRRSLKDLFHLGTKEQDEISHVLTSVEHAADKAKQPKESKKSKDDHHKTTKTKHT